MRAAVRYVLPGLLAMALTAAAGCSAGTPLPEQMTSAELQALVAERMGGGPGVPPADDVRMYGIHLQQADGGFTAEKGAALALPRPDGSFDVAFYSPQGERFERIGAPLHVTGIRPPHVGNPRDGGTCLRAKSVEGGADWYGCVIRGEVVSGHE